MLRYSTGLWPFGRPARGRSIPLTYPILPDKILGMERKGEGSEQGEGSGLERAVSRLRRAETDLAKAEKRLVMVDGWLPDSAWSEAERESLTQLKKRVRRTCFLLRSRVEIRQEGVAWWVNREE